MNYNLSVFADEISKDFSTQLKVLKKFNINYIELRSVNGVQLIEYSDKNINEFKKQMDFEGIKASSLASPIGKIDVTGDLNTHFEKFKRTVEIAEMIGAPYIRLFSFYMIRDAMPGDFKDIVINELSKYVDYVKEHDVVLLHENEKHIFGDTLDRCLYIFKNIRSDKLRAVFDPANFIQCNEKKLYEAYTQMKPYIEYFHIKDAIRLDGKVVPAGRGDGELPCILSDLKQSDFNGFISLEPHLNHSLPGADEENFKIAYDALINLL